MARLNLLGQCRERGWREFFPHSLEQPTRTQLSHRCFLGSGKRLQLLPIGSWNANRHLLAVVLCRDSVRVNNLFQTRST